MPDQSSEEGNALRRLLLEQWYEQHKDQLRESQKEAEQEAEQEKPKARQSSHDEIREFFERLRRPQTLRDLSYRIAWHEQEQKWSEGEADELRQLWSDSATRWLVEKWGNRHCPYCDHFDWLVQGEPVQLQSYLDKELISLGVQVICGNCGHYVLISASSIPLIEDEKGDE